MIHTERLTLRRWKAEDAESLYKWVSDPTIGTHAGWPPHKNIEESREIIRSVFTNDTTWAVVLRETQEVIGCVGYLTPGNANIQIAANEGEVGYWIARPYWGRNLCTEALQAMVDYCFNTVRLTRLWGDHFTDNPASGRVMRKCGFTETDIQQFKDKPIQVLRLDNPKSGH